MLRRFLLGIVALMAMTATTATAQAQSPVPPDVCGPPGGFWIGAEYLLWWTKGNALPPLLTTNPVGTPREAVGILGSGGTTTVFGDSRVDSRVRSGARFTMGSWLNDSQTTGVEGTFFLLESLATRFDISSEGTPILSRPFYDVSQNRPSSLLIALPGVLRGSFSANTSSSFLGTDAYIRQNVLCDNGYRLDVLAGYRYLRLSDRLRINETEIATDPAGFVPVGTRIDLTDRFDTRNEFHGAEVGLLGEVRRDIFYAQVLGKVALGCTHEVVSIGGVTRPVGEPAFPVGFLAAGTNSGTYRHTGLAFVPEVGMNLGCQITEYLRAYVGYTFLYWSEVVRPGQQIDLGINPTQLPPGQLVGPARPAFSRQSTDFWAQGISFGVELRF